MTRKANLLSYSEVVITLDFESSIPGSNPGKRIWPHEIFDFLSQYVRHILIILVLPSNIIIVRSNRFGYREREEEFIVSICQINNVIFNSNQSLERQTQYQD